MSKRHLLLVSSSAVALMLALPGCAEDKRIGSVPPIDSFSVNQLGMADSNVENVGDVISGELVVDVRDDLSEGEIQALGNEYHLALRDNSPGVKDDGNVEIADVDPSRIPELIARLSRDPRVEAVEQETVARAFFTPNDPKYAEQWHMQRAGAERAWEYGCGEGVTVAVVDTGIACYDDAGFMKGTDLLGTK